MSLLELQEKAEQSQEVEQIIRSAHRQYHGFRAAAYQLGVSAQTLIDYFDYMANFGQ